MLATTEAPAPFGTRGLAGQTILRPVREQWRSAHVTKPLFCPICAFASSGAVEVEGMSPRAAAQCLGAMPSTVAERAAWQALQPGIDIGRLVLIEETGASTKMGAPRQPFAARYALCRIDVHVHRKTTTFVEHSGRPAQQCQ